MPGFTVNDYGFACAVYILGNRFIFIQLFTQLILFFFSSGQRKPVTTTRNSSESAGQCPTPLGLAWSSINNNGAVQSLRPTLHPASSIRYVPICFLSPAPRTLTPSLPPQTPTG